MMKKSLSLLMMIILPSMALAGTTGKFHLSTVEIEGQAITYYLQKDNQHCVKASNVPEEITQLDETLKVTAKGKSDPTSSCHYEDSSFTFSVFADPTFQKQLAQIKFKKKNSHHWFPDILSHNINVVTQEVSDNEYSLIFGVPIA